jgi:hypothetical protein
MVPLTERLSSAVASGSAGGRRWSLAPYVTVTGPMVVPD